ncbi:L-serine ammonia-lyase [Psychromonas sp. SP041]|uniref:L-serine ammonia-lyase n=1 Tax=Psychromonas sp. SP041 TaxID=1365007 RepID=UPI0004230F57|nr:L-serine ammonia-lyase [Psychromonas sp. SP041]
MELSVFDLFKVGIGPSSSHTVGPMQAASVFINKLNELSLLNDVQQLTITLYGSLSATGIGHNTDSAIQLGLMGYDPETVDTQLTKSIIENIQKDETIRLSGTHLIGFVYARDIIFSDEILPLHANAMSLSASKGDEILWSDTFYSVGGGFVLNEAEMTKGTTEDKSILPYSFNSAAQLLMLCKTHNLSVSQLMMENEKTWRTEEEIKKGILHIWSVMQQCIANGMNNRGILPGGLNVRRRAWELHQKLLSVEKPNSINSTLSAMEWVNLYALAVNEENAAGGRVVTAPTNGASGIIPAVLNYYMITSEDKNDDDIVRFFLSATAVGLLCKKNASISGAEVGCQGEVGSACAMASAGLAEILGATPEQLENAAEIGLEHNLGLTCDPVGGLVQVPCIERNAIGAIKAINAVQMAMRGDGNHIISLDKVINTMKITGRDMSSKYKETSKGGLAINTIEC